MEYLRELTDTELDVVSGGAAATAAGVSSTAGNAVAVASVATTGTSTAAVFSGVLPVIILSFGNPGAAVAVG
jgi:hypothetical protein